MSRSIKVCKYCKDTIPNQARYCSECSKALAKLKRKWGKIMDKEGFTPKKPKKRGGA